MHSAVCSEGPSCSLTSLNTPMIDSVIEPGLRRTAGTAQMGGNSMHAASDLLHCSVCKHSYRGPARQQTAR